MNETYLEYYLELIKYHSTHLGFPHWIRIICSTRGWLPMKENELITVHFHDEEYEIRRIR